MGYDNIDLIKQYKHDIDDRINMMMRQKMIDGNSVEEVDKLWKMSKKLEKCIHAEEKNMEMDMDMGMNNIEMDMMNHHPDTPKTYYERYVNAKMNYRNNKNMESKEEMIKELNCILENYNEMFTNIISNKFDIQEEISIIKNFLQNIYKNLN